MMEKKMICDINKCLGCCCCMNICTQNAIKMVEDKLGKIIPQIDEELCISCGLCKSRCPVNNNDNFNKPQKCYALWTNSIDDRKVCASGGVSTGFARSVINNNGVVFGSRFDESLTLTYASAENDDELKPFIGSKYVQSYVGYTYKEVKKFLNEGRQVLFVGTPCQIDGLNKYLNKDYDNLITVDLICHGTPPVKYLKEHIDSVTNHKLNEITDVTFRGKYNYFLTIYKNKSIVYKKDWSLDHYFSGFINRLISRDNCFNCRYAQLRRVSDITIGDFWGLNRSTLKNSYPGRISVALINTDRGNAFFESVKWHFTFEEREIKEAVDGNAQLQKPSVIHNDRKKFESTYVMSGFAEAVKATCIAGSIRKAAVKNLMIFREVRKLYRVIFKRK